MKGRVLTKADLVDGVSLDVEIDRPRAAQLVDGFITLIKEMVNSRSKVMISGFGSFRTQDKKARKGRNPQTNETITLRKRRVVKYKCSNILRARLNGTDPALETDEE